MKSLRHLVTIATFTLLAGLAGCGAEAAPEAAAPAPAPTAATSSAAAAPSSAAPAAGNGPADTSVCEDAQLAATSMVLDALEATLSGGDAKKAVAKVLTNLTAELDKATEGAADSEVVTAVEDLRAEAADAAKSSDPAKAMKSAEFKKAADQVTSACKEIGATPPV